jgi:hypothetical protein
MTKSTSNSLEIRNAIISIVILLMRRQRRTALGEDVDHPVVKKINPCGMSGRRIKNLMKLRKMNPLHQS